MKRSGLLLSVISFALLLSGCATQSKPHATTSTSKITQTSSSVISNSHLSHSVDVSKMPSYEQGYARQMIGTEAMDFSLQNLAGQTVTLSQYSGKNVILEFAQSTCEACIASYPIVEQFKKGNPDITVLSVFPNDTKTNMQDFFRTNHFTPDSSLIYGSGMTTIAMSYAINKTPTFLFIGKNGYIQNISIGTPTVQSLTQMSNSAFN